MTTAAALNLDPQRAVLTPDEACAYLRLDGLADPAKALERCIEKGLRPAMFSRERRFTRREIDRWLDEMTDRYGDAP